VKESRAIRVLLRYTESVWGEGNESGKNPGGSITEEASGRNVDGGKEGEEEREKGG